MTRDERRRADALDRYWDATLGGERPRRPREVDDLTAAVVARLGDDPAAPDAIGPQLRVRQRVASAVNAVEEDAGPMTLARSARPNGGRLALPEPTRVDRSSQRRRWGLSLAALLLLAVGLADLALDRRRSDQPFSIPAGSDSPPPPTIEETLVAVSVTAEALAPGDGGSVLADLTIPPGVRSTWTAPRNVGLLFVLSGTVSVHPDGALQVQRAGRVGTWEVFEAGVAVSLGPGDAVLLLQPASVAVDNLGPAPAELLGWSLAAGGSADGPIPSAWIVHDQDASGANGVSLPGENAWLQLRRVELPPASVIAMPSGVFVHLAVARSENDDGTPQVTPLDRLEDGSLRNAGSETISVYVVTMKPWG